MVSLTRGLNMVTQDRKLGDTGGQRVLCDRHRWY